MPETLNVGAVAYHPRVLTIWDAFAAWFAARGSPVRPILFDTYDEQLEALFQRRIDVAWNTNLAYVEAQRRAGGGCDMLAMRDNDRDWRSHLVVREDSDALGLADLAGKRIGLASSDSPQATILPVYFMQQQGFDPDRDAKAERLEVDLGKHGDTGGAERGQLARLVRGEIDAAVLADATCAGTFDADSVDGVKLRRVWTTPPYHHCNFTVLPDHDRHASAGFRNGLMAMSPADPVVSEAMREEWVGRWVDADESGYADLYDALGVAQSDFDYSAEGDRP
jgi:phosphonate transport system substrate-binding protein